MPLFFWLRFVASIKSTSICWPLYRMREGLNRFLKEWCVKYKNYFYLEIFVFLLLVLLCYRNCKFWRLRRMKLQIWNLNYFYVNGVLLICKWMISAHCLLVVRFVNCRNNLPMTLIRYSSQKRILSVYNVNRYSVFFSGRFRRI